MHFSRKNNAPTNYDFMDDDTLCDISPINGNLINTLNWSGPYLVLSALLLSLKHLSRNNLTVFSKTQVIAIVHRHVGNVFNFLVKEKP